MTFRYLIPADQSFPAGQYTVKIVPNQWGDSLSNAPDNLASSYTFKAVNVEAEVIGPFVMRPRAPIPTRPLPSVQSQPATYTVPTGYTAQGQTLPYIDVNFLPAPGAQINDDSILGRVQRQQQPRCPASRAVHGDIHPGRELTPQTLTVYPEPIPITTAANSVGTSLMATPVTGTLDNRCPTMTTLGRDSVTNSAT